MALHIPGSSHHIPHKYTLDSPQVNYSEIEHGFPITPRSIRRLESYSNIPRATDQLVPQQLQLHHPPHHLHSYSPQQPRQVLSQIENGESVAPLAYHSIEHSSPRQETPQKPRKYPKSVQEALDHLDNSIRPHAHDVDLESNKSNVSTRKPWSYSQPYLVYDRTAIARNRSRSAHMSSEEEEVKKNIENWIFGEPHHNGLHRSDSLSNVYDTYLQDLIDQHGALPRCVLLTPAQEFYYFCFGFSPLFLLYALLTTSRELDPILEGKTLSRAGLCYLLSAYVAMMTTYVYRGNNLPVKSFGIPALVFMSILSMLTAALIVGEFSVPEAVWYVLLVLIGICAGVCMSVFEIMSSLFPGGRSVCMINWGRGFAFLLPALAELGFVLFCHFKPTGDWSFASRIKSCVLFVLAALFIMCSIQGLLVLTRSGIFKLFRGKRIFFNSNVTGDKNEEKTIFWSDIWGYLILQFATAGITMYILVGAYGISTATKDALATPVFYNAFWERFHAPMIIMLFLCGGFIGVCVTACSRFKTVVDSNCAMMSLFIPSILRTGLIAIFLVYMHKPFLTSHGVFSMILYFFTAFSDVIIQHSLASYCQKLVGFLPKKLVCCNVGMICLMSQLLGATTGAVLSFVSLQALQ